MIIKFLLDKYNGDLRKAIKHYKGIENNNYIVENTIKIYKGILK